MGSEAQTDAAAALDAAGWRLHSRVEPSAGGAAPAPPFARRRRSAAAALPPPSAASPASSLGGGYNRWFRWPPGSTAGRRNINEHFDQGTFLFFDPELLGGGAGVQVGGQGGAKAPPLPSPSSSQQQGGGGCRGWSVRATGPRFAFAFTYLRKAQPRRVGSCSTEEGKEEQEEKERGRRRREREARR